MRITEGVHVQKTSTAESSLAHFPSPKRTTNKNTQATKDEMILKQLCNLNCSEFFLFCFTSSVDESMIPFPFKFSNKFMVELDKKNMQSLSALVLAITGESVCISGTTSEQIVR